MRRPEWGPVRLQLYVDDPVAVAWGRRHQRENPLNIIVVLWLVLGIPLSWRKGALFGHRSPHRWIGVEFVILGPSIARMTLPPSFVAEVADICAAFQKSTLQPLSTANALVGKAGRIAHVPPP